MSRKAAHILAAQVTLKPESVLGLATGSTPIGTYDCLAEWCKSGDLDFSKAATVNLDEYRGLDHSNDQSYYYFMNKHLYSRINIDHQKLSCAHNGSDSHCVSLTGYVVCGSKEALVGLDGASLK